MNKEDIKIVFLGTPDFAVASLAALVDNNYNVVAVVTAPDKPAGRGQKIHQSAVKEYAVSKNIPVLQPEKLKNKSFLAALRSYEADVQVVVAFRMLPEVVWNMPKLGTINVHGSLLPQYRGAAPINWAIINGEKVTGVTTFKLQHAIDTGDIMLQSTLEILPEDNIGTVYTKLMELGAQTLVRTMEGIIDNSIQEVSQDSFDVALKHAPKIFTETCKIDWNNTVFNVHNLIRGLSPKPGAFTMVGNKTFKIYESSIDQSSIPEKPGTILTDNKTFLKLGCKDGWLSCIEIQLEGKKRMPIGDFLRGNQMLFNSINQL